MLNPMPNTVPKHQFKITRTLSAQAEFYSDH